MSSDPSPQGQSHYDDLLMLEDLETLLEELEEAGIEGDLDKVQLTSGLREQVEAAAVRSTGELRARIETIHRRLDAE